MVESSPPVVVVAAADADRYETWLPPEYEVRAADSRETLVECVDGDVDVAVVERTFAGDGELLAALREASPHLRIPALVGEDPSFDVIESGFDAALRTPVDRERLGEAVDELLADHEFAERVLDFGEVVTEEAPPPADATPVEDDDIATAVGSGDPVDDVEETEEQLAEQRDRLTDDAAFVGTLREVTGEEGEIAEAPGSEDDGTDAGGDTGDGGTDE